MSTKGKNQLTIEITLVLCIKVLLLLLLWFAFFSSPLDEYLTTEQVGQILFDPALNTTNLPKEVK